MTIDHTAPLSGQKEIVIEAPVESVWALLTDIDRWPEWQPDISSAQLEGALAAGSTFRWKAMGLKITSTLQEVSPPLRIGWTGTSLGMRAIHTWKLDPEGASTRVTTAESLSGWVPRLLKLVQPGFLEKSLAGSLAVLKARAEAGTASTR